MLLVQPISDVYAQIRALALATQQNCVAIQAAVAAGPVSCNLLMPLLSTSTRLARLLQATTANAALSAALVTYTQAQAADPTLDVVGEITTSLTALSALSTALAGEYPHSTDGSLADR